MEEVLVNAACGRVLGLASAQGAVFRGIRYAAPPVGPLRFLAPQPLLAATQTIDARRPGPDAWQLAVPHPLVPEPQPQPMDEDCLHLGVWTPAADGARRPVLVHVFGGGFQRGSANSSALDAAALAARSGAVVVRIGFRLGALGFLGAGDQAPANLALLDAALALRWVRANIGAFGGDPERVTLFGLSSGAFMIAALLAMPQARSCFQGAWMQSGSASRILGRDQARTVEAALCARLGVAAGNHAALRALPAATIVQAQESVLAADLGERNAPGGRTFGIVLDGTTLPEHPLQAIARGAVRDTGLVFGSTRDEARMWFQLGVMRECADIGDLRAEIARFVGADQAPALLAAYLAALPGASLATLRERFLSHAIYRVPALRSALAQRRAGGRAHLMRFDWQGVGPWAAHGASHAFDEPFVWGQSDPQRHRYLEGSADAAALADRLCTALTRFAHEGDPGWPLLNPAQPRPEVFGAVEPAPLEAEAAILEAWSAAH